MLTCKQARNTYNFNADFFSPNGRVTFTDYSSARRFATQISIRRANPVPASDIYALYLIDEALRILIHKYISQNAKMMTRAKENVRDSLGDKTDEVFIKFVDEFPPMSVYLGDMTAKLYFIGTGQGEKTIEDILLVNITNLNPAIQPYKDLFDETPLNKTDAYVKMVAKLTQFFNNQPGFEGKGSGDTLINVLREHALVSPYSLEGQLVFLIQKWGFLLGESFITRLLRGIDFIREEIIRKHTHGDFPLDVPVPTYKSREYHEYERYSHDRDWMPQIVLIAKNSYVWMEQLSQKYKYWVKTLDRIPDEELDLLARRGFNGLWLIGLWERSKASQRIKQRMGMADAAASAYSLHSYDIAADLGGWEALNNLRERAWQRGIRLSADMVPNHMGIDSAWVIEHPDWFLSLNNPPYPAYSFNSEDLSDDMRVGIFIEDHYYNKTDAAVIFKRLDRYTGDTRFIYHGNDGTSFPWNDTAQLDYSQARVREAVIQVILHVARNFPVIRFDAAMTLAKKHIQRLWFPEPGAGGAIPSRSERGMTVDEFEAAIPQEFWREVVDRIAAEVPDTLLLAEAYWLMEGYFVRTLGMHRVYNSAFMHMLRDEDNAKYRMAIKNTLEFDPQILKRYVNFMSNPDEKTAVEQFGSHDKYFGVCTLLITLPGLPMFGHGQIEGLREKYGMEFRYPRLIESQDEGLLRGHEWKIFPLLHRRYLFANVEAFLLFDFYTSNGQVDENVFAYSNRFGDFLTNSGQVERGLIIYHNKFAETRGWIKISAAYMNKDSGRKLQKSLSEGLNLPHKGYIIFKDYVTHLEYIRSCSELWDKGLYVELNAYQCHAFMDFQIVSGEYWEKVCQTLNGAGVQSVTEKYDELLVTKEQEVGEIKIKKHKPHKTAVTNNDEDKKDGGDSKV
ncbi:MAG: alpha-amylase family glycosyl hydrolase [Deltaproteobacteria bacterium]